jgi:hypothetical protein
MSLSNNRTSVFVGNVAERYSPGSFAEENYVFADREDMSDGDWFFCTFDHPDVLGLRVGYQCGTIDRSDYGGRYQEDFLQLHLEIVTSDKILSWIASGKYSSQQVASSSDPLRIMLQGEDMEIFRIEDWPNRKLAFKSDDGSLSVDLSLDVPWVVLLPDLVLKKIRFGMWWTAGPLQATVHMDGRCHDLSGSFFHDHARTSSQDNEAGSLGMYLYTPIRFDDGSVFLSYYAEDDQSNKIEYYSFGMLMDKDGRHTEWYPHLDLVAINFDRDGIPATWELTAANSDSRINLKSNSCSPKAFSTWGFGDLPHDRSSYKYLPNIFTCNAVIHRGSNHISRKGSGMSEYYLTER